ncbi:aminotransferase class III-fold pyridoxal phosphate-dependent enzyme [Marinibaculum pumilum]|uniref:Aminotransferase class III-fold pyridoxal phosphate-dependent enzyme n=1 Tax=Marinibaculum pumilum TaxID=1766165 RepID=A0ABV7KXE3_9PROT
MAEAAAIKNILDPALVLGFSNLREMRTVGPHRIAAGHGIYVTDTDGKDYIEGASCFYCSALGFSEEELVEAAVRQFRELPFYSSGLHRAVPAVMELAEKLRDLTPIKNAKIALGATGSEANDFLLKFVRAADRMTGRSGRWKVISRLRSYHGGTLATASMTGVPESHAQFGLPLPGFLHTHQPDYFNMALPGEDEAAFTARMLGDLRDLIEREGPETIACMVAEPVSLSAGLVPPPEGYWAGLQALLAEYGIRLFADEVITGFGRTGPMFGSETYGIDPECITLAKAMSGAYLPVSAVVMAPDFYDALELASDEAGGFTHAGTYAGHPVCAAVALRTIELFEERDILGHVARIAPRFAAGLAAFADHPLVGDTRSVGLCGAVEFVAAKAPRRAPQPEGILSKKFAAFAKDRGLIVRMPYNSVCLAPPLVITESEIDEMCARFGRALHDLEAWAAANPEDF